MPTRPSRLERITNLVLALLETTRPLSLREIGATVAGYPPEPGALRQSFERDKRTLRDGGIPIAVERLDNDDQVGYRILPEEYYLPDLGLDDDEQEALSFALAAIRLEGSAGEDVASRIGLRSTPDLPPIAVLPDLPALSILQEAIRRRVIATFDYHGRRRTVAGYGLAFRQGSWYFVGNDESVTDPEQLRTFRVDRIEGDVSLDAEKSYEVPADFDLSSRPFRAAFAGPSLEEGASSIELVVDATEVGAVTAVLGPNSVAERHDDGSARFSLLVADEDAFVGFVLGLAHRAEVLAPPSLRSRVIAELSAVAAVKR